MDKVFSTRLDERIIFQIDRFVKDRPISKKSLVEAALKKYLKENQASTMKTDIIRESCGSWARDESGDETRKNIRKIFNKGYERHQDPTESGKSQ